jgi:hypothetical protein
MSLMIDLVSSDDDTTSVDCEEIGLTEDEKFAWKLQKEFDAEKRTVEEFECPICMDDKPIDSKFIYQNCDHEQCRDCASEFFLRQIELKNKINCVLCQKEVATLDLELVLSSDMVRKYLKTHNMEGGQYEDGKNDADDADDDEEPVNNNFIGNVVNMHPAIKKAVPKAKPVAPKLGHLHPTKKATAKKVAHKVPVRRAQSFEHEASKPRANRDREYLPELNEKKERKSQRTPRYDRTSSDSDSYDVPKKIRKTSSTKKLAFDT